MSAPAKVGTISAETQYHLGSGLGSRVSTLMIQFESQSFTGEVSILSRTQRGGDDSDSDVDRTLLTQYYTDEQTGDGADTAAITGNKSIRVDASGKEIYADCTSLATGSLDFTAIPLLG